MRRWSFYAARFPHHIQALRALILVGAGSALLSLLAACGPAPAPAVTPTGTMQPIISTAPISGTVTVTGTLQPITPQAVNPVVPQLQEALTKSSQLTDYRIHFSVAVTQTQENPAQPPFTMDYQADFRGKNAAWKLQSPQIAGGLLNNEINGVLVDTTYYAYGPLPLKGAEATVWYRMPSNVPQLTASLYPAYQLIQMTTNRVDLGDFQDDGTAMIDGASCRRYKGGLSAALGMVDGMSQATTPEAKAEEATPVLQRMKARGFTFANEYAEIVVCPDGLVHHLSSHVTTIPGAQPEQSAFLSVDLTLLPLTDNGAIQAPADAVALPSPEPVQR